MIYCKKCLLPSTKPDLMFNDNGVCSACEAHDNKKLINWEARKDIFREIVKEYTSGNSGTYDCIVPVSGGKDSTYQVIKVIEQGLKPLAVAARTCHLSDLGRSNLDNISNLGVDIVEVGFNAKLRKRLNRYCLETIGDISWPEHVSIFTAPLKEAILRGIGLVVYGENSQHEYGGPKTAQEANELSSRWLSEFGGLNGLRVADVRNRLCNNDPSLLARDFDLLRYPVAPYGVKQVFLGHYFPWNGYQNALIANANGFTFSPKPVEGNGKNYENLDNYQTGIHDYFKYLKFGFGRATDLASIDIRFGRMTRAQGVHYVRLWDGQPPTTYLGKSLEEILDNIEMTIDEFMVTVYRFMNKDLFEAKFGQWPTPKFRVE